MFYYYDCNAYVESIYDLYPRTLHMMIKLKVIQVNTELRQFATFHQ